MLQFIKILCIFVWGLVGSNYPMKAEVPTVAPTFSLGTNLKIGTMKTIELTQGKVAIVDDEDYEFLNQYKWRACKNRCAIYALSNIKDESGKIKQVSMHRLIMGKPIGLEIDHINHNGLDNRKENLRICTSLQNRFNCNSYKGSSSKYKGVCWDKNAKKWSSKIRVNKILKNLGSFKSEIEAAREYNVMAKLHFGEYANLNNV